MLFGRNRPLWSWSFFAHTSTARRVTQARRLVAASCLVALVGGCRKPAADTTETSASAPIPSVERIPAELATRVLAKVGDRVITVADYATVLDRMDPMERLRYQSTERRKALLDELVNTELMAREAERRGLDKRPETQAYVNQLLADEVRRRLRASLPAPEALPVETVQAYYAAHRDEFRQPERRRVAVLTLPSKAVAEKVVAELGKDAELARWNELGRAHSTQSQGALSLPTPVFGDVGFVTAQGDAEGEVPVPAPVRAAAFQIAGTGVAPAAIEHERVFYLVRVTTVAPAHLPTLEEADAQVRARVLDGQLAERERELQKALEKATPVEVNEAVISRLKQTTPKQATP